MARLCVLLVAACLLVQCALGARITVLGVTSDPCADIAPYNAAGANTAILNNCIASSLPDSAVTIYIPSEGSQSATGASRTDPLITGAGRTVTITVLSNTLTEGIVAGQSVCLSTRDPVTGVSDCSGVVTESCNIISQSGTGELTFTITQAWDDIAYEFEDSTRAICIQNAPGSPAVYSGLQAAVVFNCGVNADCTAHPGITQTGRYSGIPLAEARLLATRTQCCINAALGTGAGICINPNVQSCCGGIALENGIERCCDAANHRIRGINQACPCFGTFAGGANATGCPADETCCLPTKFNELSAIAATLEGRCFDGNVTRCCNTGELYDPGTAQCCVINGVQSLNFPCPCDNDDHCLGASQGVNQQQATSRCCRQTFPSSIEAPVCTPYSNFPAIEDLLGVDLPAVVVRDNLFRVGQNAAQLQRCPGVCVDTRFQMCCNGVACVQGYEKCCNNTCCNKFVGKCAESYRSGSSSSRVNPINFNTPFEVCTIIENLGPLKTYWVFVLPTFLLVATLSSLALVIIYASSQTTRAFSFVERAIVFLAVILVLCAIPTFFSPTYKYGIVTVIVGLIAILAASARVWWLNVLAVGASIVLLLFLIDPFNGNWFFNFANGRLFNGNPDFEQMGILHSLDKMWTGTATWQRSDFCVQFYDYFALDPLLADFDRKEQIAQGVFGYCVREWVAALLIIELFVILLALLLFIMLVLALTLRFRKVAPLPVAVAQEPAYVDLY